MLIKAHALEKDDNGAKVRNTPNFRIFGKKENKFRIMLNLPLIILYLKYTSLYLRTS